MYEVILFCGPRYSGKTAYYRQQLSHTHARVSADDIYRKKPSSNLHVVIKQFISSLKQKKLVIVDDENLSVETRQSYIRAINKQEFVDGCKISCFEFSPYHGKQQCLWTAQWALASKEAWLIRHAYNRTTQANDNSSVNTLSITCCAIPDYANIINTVYRSFTCSVKPSKEEGFGEVRSIESQLVCISQYEFTIPALLIQWNCLVGGAGSALMEACHHWQMTNAEGRIIIVSNNENNGWKEGVESICKLLEKYPHLVIYYIISASTLSHMIAWLQFRHTIALYHAATVYVWSCESHRDCAKSLGIINMNLDHISSKPKAITCVHHSTDIPPLMLKRLIYCCPETQQQLGEEQDSGINVDTYVSTWTSTGPTKNSTKENYQLPLFGLAYMLNKQNTSTDTLSFCFNSKKLQCSIESSSSGTGWYNVYSDTNNYCTHGLLYKNWTELCQYHQRTMEKIVIVTNKNCSACFMKKSGDDSIKEKKPTPSPCILTPVVPTKKHKPTAGLMSPRNNRNNKRAMLLPVLTHEELLSHAADSGTYARAEGYQENVFDVRCAPDDDNDEFVISCQCHGTGANPYRSQCTVSNTGVIVGSGCSCHIGSTNGKCKHVIAMLLVYMKQQGTKVGTRALPIIPSAGISDERKEVRTLTKSRSLPKWVSEAPPPMEDERPPKKKRNENLKPAAYKMNDSDFMRTALEIMDEPDVVADTEQASLVAPSIVEQQQSARSCDSPPLISSHADDKDDTPMSVTTDDDLTQEVDYTADNFSVLPDRDLNHSYSNSNFTDEMGERIESSLSCDVNCDGQKVVPSSLPPSPVHDKPRENDCDGPSDVDSLLDELFT